MNRWMGKIVWVASLSGTLGLALGGIAMAQAAPDSAQAQSGMHNNRGHREGLLGQALLLESLTGEQRASLEQLVASQRTARLPVRQADAGLLTVLAQQVEAGAIDSKALAPSVQVKESAEVSARAMERDLIHKLHALLTASQRGQLVDAIEARRQAHARPEGEPHEGRGGELLTRLSGRLGLSQGQTQQIASNLKAEASAQPHGTPPGGAEAVPHRAWLESFRGDTFNATPADATGAAMLDRRDGRVERVLEAAVPVLTQEQRVALADRLRARAAHESRS
jgi:Spy/CpxP family protein refolding chaperone